MQCSIAFNSGGIKNPLLFSVEISKRYAFETSVKHPVRISETTASDTANMNPAIIPGKEEQGVFDESTILSAGG